MATERNIVGPQVRRIRYEKRLSQPALAATCQRIGWDIARDTIAKIEGQKRWVGDFELILLARALEVGLDALFPQQAIRTLNRRGNRIKSR
jgi:transcriptional regulator with XRE-family HTH domain